MKLVKCDGLNCPVTARADQSYGAAPESWTTVKGKREDLHFCSVACLVEYHDKPNATRNKVSISDATKSRQPEEE